MTEEQKSLFFAGGLALVLAICIVYIVANLPSCVPVGQEDNGDGRIETLYIGKC